MGKRGEVTIEVKEMAKELLGIEDISTVELRLMPYLQYIMLNERCLDPQRINNEERKIFQEWKAKGWVDGGMAGLEMSKEFWDKINEILWVSYVICD